MVPQGVSIFSIRFSSLFRFVLLRLRASVKRASKIVHYVGVKLITFLIVLACPLMAQPILGPPIVVPILPAYQQGYTSAPDGCSVRPIHPRLLPTIETVEALALTFGALIRVRPMSANIWTARSPLPEGWQLSFTFCWPLSQAQAAVERTLVFGAGVVLPSGYALQKEISIPAWFLSDALDRGLKYPDLWRMIQQHAEESR